MSLKTYAEKRRFDKTPEPPASESVRRAKSPLRFCVQRHHASHLHYDFRLELGGALKSWAVPKGPTLDPDQKRLAMMVEDHPIEYGSFEGNIPKGNYGGGSVMLWDRGTYEMLGAASPEEQLERGDFKFVLHGEKLSGEFAIVRMKRGKGNEWLLLKKRDAYATPGWDPEDHATSVITGRVQEEIAREKTPLHGAGEPEARSKAPAVKLPKSARQSEMPKIVAPMLAEIAKEPPPATEDWLYEIKWDGVRALCSIEDGALRITSRNGNAIEKQYPELAILPHQIQAKQAILDGEIAALDEKGRPSFELLQRRMHLADAAVIARLGRSQPVTLFLFDLIYLDGHDLRGVPLIERKNLLQQILTPSDTVRYSEHFAGAGAELLEAAKAQGLEGIVGKRAASTYEPRRSSAWQKWKVADSADFVICGFTAGEREGFGALVLGEPAGAGLQAGGLQAGGRQAGGLQEVHGLHWAGNVGTGFDSKGIAELRKILQPLAVAECPLKKEKGLPKEVTWVEPRIGCEIRFSNRTSDGRLRAPVFVRLRDDVEPPSRVHVPLLEAGKAEIALTVDGRRVKFTNLSKPYYPKDGYTKRDVLNYYDAVAPLLLPHLKDRPLSLKRYPDGIEKQHFFQKNMPDSTPKWVRTVLLEENRMPVCDDRSTLLYLVNLGCIDHNPWMSRVASVEHPDYVLIDLDPQRCGYDRIVEAALWVRARLEKAGLESYPKTTGGDGMHIFIPIESVYSYGHAKAFAEALATLGAAERPDLFTTPRSVVRRENGKVYFDWMQIGEGKTISAPYVLRAYPGAPVATPLEWKEVTPRLRPEQFHLGNALARFDRTGDLFAAVLHRPQRLEKAVERLL
ncbi:MAG: DNA ligase D [Bryobacteraceae bacterium]